MAPRTSWTESGAAAYLLRVFQEREIDKTGPIDKTMIDIPIVAATHFKLLNRVEVGAFRQVLHYCLAGLPYRKSPPWPASSPSRAMKKRSAARPIADTMRK